MDGIRGSLLSGGREPEPADVRALVRPGLLGKPRHGGGGPQRTRGLPRRRRHRTPRCARSPAPGREGGPRGWKWPGGGSALRTAPWRCLSSPPAVSLSFGPSVSPRPRPSAVATPHEPGAGRRGQRGPQLAGGTAQPRGGTARHTGRRAGVVASVGWPPQELLRHHSPSGQHPRRAGRVWGEAGRLHRAPEPPPKAPGL